MFKHGRFRAAALTIAVAIAVSAVSLVATSSAQADEGAYRGKVVAKTLPERKYPTTYGKMLKTYTKNAIVRVKCKIDAVDVAGNRRWYGTTDSWLPARYVQNVGKAPGECDGYYGAFGNVTKKPLVNLRSGPTNKSKLVGISKYGRVIEVICKVEGPTVGGNPDWHQIRDGRFVTAHYVKITSEVTGPLRYCNA